MRDNSCSFGGGQRSCQYKIGYGDGSRSKGALSLDTLTLISTNGSAVSFPKHVIGCGNINTLIFEGEETNTPSKLYFGEDAVVSGDGTVSTPMFSDTVFYFLTLEAFSVGKRRLEFRSTCPGIRGPGNIIIDSGTTLTLFPRDVYSSLELAVADVVELERTRDTSKLLSLCYKTPPGQKAVLLLVITTHFKGANIQLKALNTFVQVSKDVICFAFTLTNQVVSIFGNLAQLNFVVNHYLQKKTLSFKPTDCKAVINFTRCLLLVDVTNFNLVNYE
ncbi:hypothetical protein Lal_00018969 [Lupinus albus]|nr:hypothetical protein Lal_00018969 [Lupinus albus]